MANTITVKKSDNTDVVFNLKSLTGSKAVFWAPALGSPTEPFQLEIELVNKDLTSTASDRAIIRTSRFRKNAQGKPVATNVSTSVVTPRDTAITDTDVADCEAITRNLVGNAAVFAAIKEGLLYLGV